jgi:hypothetical protein
VSTKPEIVPLNTEEFVEPVAVFTTITKFEVGATVKE